ncbi:MAG: hypothetical protein IKB08_03585 [Clostridia bacterium]|nr:hypothetical protein [Clostridia bacterium]
MNKKIVKALGLILCFTMLLTSAPLSGFVAFATENEEEEKEIVITEPDYLVGNTTGTLRLPDSVPESVTQEELLYGEPVEITEFTKVYQVDENTFSSVLSPVPNFYYDAKGNMREFDNSLVLDKKLFGADEFTNTSSNIDVSFSADMLRKGMSFEKDGIKVNLIPVEGDYSKYAVVDNAVRYNDVYEGIDVQYVVHELGVKEDIILNKYVDRNVFLYEIDAGRNKIEIVDNVINVYNDKNEVAFTLSAPGMTDANGKTSDEVILSYENGIITVTADSQWLSAPERAYPVYIDPSFSVESGAIQLRSCVEDGDRVYVADPPYARAYVGNISAAYYGFELGRSKTLIYVNPDSFAEIPAGAGIKSASFNIYQYVSLASTEFWCFQIDDAWKLSDFSSPNTSKGFTRANGLNSHFVSASTSKKGWHSFDIREAVNSWVNVTPGSCYGLVLATKNNSPSEIGGAFVTNTTTSATDGPAAYYQNKPYISVTWEVPNPVDLNYPLNNTTINLRPITVSDRNGKLAVLGIFADGVAKPYSVVDYIFSDPSAEYQTSYTIADISYKYPDSSLWNDEFAKQGRATKYKDIISNWQTAVPFTNYEFNKVYNWNAKATLDGVTGNTVKSSDFLIYKITRFDTLASIANHYGVSVESLALNNHVQDMLLVENNTLIVIDPTKNADIPYNPAELTDDEKRNIDSLLIGRSKHCEFGFEPVNLNTGNFYMNQTDISIDDIGGEFAIGRTYNSKGADVNSVFGRGWQFDYSEQLSKLADGTIVYRRGDGSSIYFSLNPDGTYTCNPGYYLEITPIVVETKLGDFGGEELEEYNVYEYEIRSSEDEVRRFSSDGTLKYIIDKRGFKTALSYDDNRNLKSITSPSGNVYEIVSDPTGLIKAVTVPGGHTLKYDYNEKGDLISFTNELGYVTTYNYNSEHLMTSWADAENNVIVTNTYDSDGRVTKQVDSEGGVTLFEYGSGYTKTTDANGNVTVYNFDENYRTTSIIYDDGTAEYKYYDAANNLSKVTDRSGKSTEYKYNSDGFVTEIIRFDGAKQSMQYDENGNLSSTTDFDGKVISYTYDNKGNVLSQTNKDNSVKKYEYDENCRVIKYIDELGNVSTYEYDGIWVSEITDALGNTIEYFYNQRGDVVTMIDALGNTTRYFYDAAGRNTGYQTEDGAAVTYTYDKAGCLKTLKNANGYVYTYEYDGMGNITKLTDPLLNEVVYTYDGLYNTLSTSFSADNVTYNEYDCFSQTVSVTDEEGNKTSYKYDNAGNVVEVTDAENNTTKYTYDLRFNKIETETDALGNKTSYEYDLVGNLIRKTDAKGNVTEYAYDSRGNVTEIRYSNGLVVSHTYDLVGNLLTTTTDGKVTEYTYDNVYNLTSVKYPNGATLSYTYDALGRKLTEKDSAGATAYYTYDCMGRLSSITDSVGRKTEYTYDNNGNLLSEKTSNGGVTTYVYDALDRQCKVTDALGNSTIVEFDSVGNMRSTTNALGAKTAYEYSRTGLVTKQTDAMGGVFTFTYDKNGNVIKATDAAGYEATISYDALGRTVATKDALGLETTFKYDELGNLIEDSNNNGVKNIYEYDSVGNLVKSTDSLGQVMTYSYDLNGNLLSVKSYDGTTTSYAYDMLNNISSMTDAENKTTTYAYDIVGNLTSVKDAQNRTYSYSYDSAGRTTKVVDPLGRATKYEYNDFDFITKQINPDNSFISNEYDIGGNLISETDANGNKTSYSYDKIYRLIKVTYADNTEDGYKYDANDNLIEFKDSKGNKTAYTYNALGYTESITEANGSKTVFETDANGNILSETDALGYVTNYVYDRESRLVSKTLANTAVYTYSYDALGRITAETLPEGLSVFYTYDSKGDLVAETDQSGRKTTYTYDKMHRLTSTTDAAGNVTGFAYDNAGNLKTLTTAKGYVTEYKYDALDRITELLNPAGKTEKYTYDLAGNLASVTENGGRVTGYAYDKMGNVVSVTNAAGLTRTVSYDKLYRVVSESDYKGQSFRYKYDENGNLISLTDRAGNKTEYIYDEVNNLISEVDEENRRKDYAYDALGRLTSVTQAGMYQSSYEYDNVGNLVKAGGYVYSYDLNGNLTASTNALGDITSYIYNANGILETVRNADGSTVNYDYDKIDQLVSKKYDGETISLYGYDADGNRVSMEDVAGTSNYQYDSLGRVTAITLSDGKSKITYEYDVYGNLTKLGYPDGTSVKYKYDNLNQLVSITNRDGENTAYKYDANGNVKEVHRPNNTYTIIEYDKNDQITSFTNYGMVKFLWFFKKTVVFSSFKYEYDGTGNIISEVEKTFSSTNENDLFTWLFAQFRRESVTRTYEYDGRNQLVEMRETTSALFSVKSSSSYSYEYDVNGNRIKEVADGDVTTYTYNSAGQLVSSKNSDGTTEYTYDKNGNLISEKAPACLNKTDAKTYTYDNENRLTAIKENGALLMAALYDGDGERIFTVSKYEDCSLSRNEDKSCASLASGGLLGADKALIENTMLIPNGVSSSDFSDYDLTAYVNNINTEYTQVLMEYGANGKLTAAYEYGIFRESAKLNGEQFYYEYDGRGSVVSLLNTKGKNAESYSYDPYGKLTDGGDRVANPYQYNAEYVDTATGLQYLRARYYRAETGSFITADTYRGEIESPLSLNRYTYTHNNPIMGKDPSGHSLWSSIKSGIKSAGNWVNKNIVQPVKKTVNNVVTGVKNFINDPVGTTKQCIDTAIEKGGQIVETVGNGYNAVKNKVSEGYTYVKQQVKKKICEGKEMISKAWDKTVEAVKNVDWGKVAQTVAVVTAGVVMTAAIIATAGAAGAAVGMAAGLYLGASAATMATVTTVATTAAYVIAGATALVTASDVGEIVTDGHNVIRDDIYGAVLNQEDAETAYNATRIGLTMFGSSIITVGSNNQALVSNNKKTENPATTSNKQNNGTVGDNSSSNSQLPKDTSSAHAPVGSKHNPIKFYQDRRNEPTTINGRDYSGHALDRMQERGVMPSVVENTIKVGTPEAGNGPGATVYYDSINDVSVVLNEKGKVVTTYFGKK